MTDQKAFYVDNEGYVSIKKVNGEIAPFSLLKDPIAKKYSGFRLILKDLLTVKECLAALKPLVYNGQSSIEKQSLSFYAVVTYGKCYTESKGRGSKLDEKDSLKYATETQKQEHARIMHERHDYVAHAGLTGFEQNPIVVSLNPSEPKQVIEIYDNLMSLVDIDSQLDEFDGLVDAQIKYVREVCSKTLKKLQEKVSEMDLDKLYDNSILPKEIESPSIKVSRKK